MLVFFAEIQLAGLLVLCLISNSLDLTTAAFFDWCPLDWAAGDLFDQQLPGLGCWHFLWVVDRWLELLVLSFISGSFD